MTDLPSSIEHSLIEAGFTQTELLVLRRLLEADALTLRELAAKTGKSTGVLDQATKKLLKKRIIAREVVNDTPKYVLRSLESILTWIQEDAAEKLQTIQNRAKDFESFVSSMKREAKRPEMEHFEGREGIEQAYMKLLESVPKGSELLHIRPTPEREEEDPLRVFRVQYFRERRKRGIFSRTITTNTPLGRRFQSRDPFEYRQTQLIPEEDLAISFEKVIAGDTIACFNHAEQKASFLKFPELAAEERRMFEMLWNRGKTSTSPSTPSPAPTQPIAIPFETKTLSALREFLLSRKSIAALALCGILAAAVTYGLYRQASYLNLQRIREKAVSIAATGAMQFDLRDLDELRTEADITKEIYKLLVYRLRDIRHRNKGVVYAYIWRPTEDPNIMEFVVDADSLNPDVQVDLNRDGSIDEADTLSPPGDTYDLNEGNADEFWRAHYLDEPVADSRPVTDQWGTFISATAPIRNERGETKALFAVDFDAGDVGTLTEETFTPILYFLGFFVLFLLLRLAAVNRLLLLDVTRLLTTRRILVTVSFSILLALGIAIAIDLYTFSIIKTDMQKKLMAIAATAAKNIDANDIEALHKAKDMEKPEYQRIFTELNRIKDMNKDITWAYVMRPTSNPVIWEFIGDAESNYFMPFSDLNNDGIIQDIEENTYPGLMYDATGQEFANYYKMPKVPMYEKEIIQDQWGALISAMAPIFNSEGQFIAVLGVDKDVTELKDSHDKRFSYLSVTSIILLVFITLWFVYSSRMFQR